MRPGEHLRRHAVGYLALFVALSGTSYAAIKLPKNSVGTKQLRNGAVTTRKIAVGTRSQLRGQTGPRGPAGEPGSRGEPGAPGAPGPGAAHFGFERTADAASPNLPSYTLGSGYGITIRATCSVGGPFSAPTVFLYVDPDRTGTLTYSYSRDWSTDGPDSAANTAQILDSDAPFPMMGFTTNDNAEGSATISAGFDDGSTTVIISAFAHLDKATNRCRAFGGLWPAS